MSDDFQHLALRAQAGDADAMTILGKRMLFGDGMAPSPQKAFALIDEAARRTNGEALAIVARLEAWGVMRAVNVSRALDLLSRSAEAGWEPAQKELRFLAKTDGDDWTVLRKKIDLQAWGRHPPSELALNRPRAYVYKNFASHAECDWIIARLKGEMERAKVFRGIANPMVADTRTNSEAAFMLKSSDIPMCFVRNRIASALRISPVFCEVTKLLHYSPGQTFKAHTDYFDPAVPALRDEIDRRGQRFATFLIYLSDDYEGGETEFSEVDFRHKGKKGDALLFFSVDANGAPEPTSKHAGLPPTSGEKWVLSQWIGSRPINPFMTPGPKPSPLGSEWLASFMSANQDS